MTRPIAAEIGKFGIAANRLQPGVIDTWMTADFFADLLDFEEFWIMMPAIDRSG